MFAIAEAKAPLAAFSKGVRDIIKGNFGTNSENKNLEESACELTFAVFELAVFKVWETFTSDQSGKN